MKKSLKKVISTVLACSILAISGAVSKSTVGARTVPTSNDYKHINLNYWKGLPLFWSQRWCEYFPYFEGEDSANYVSQCLYVGDYKVKYPWGYTLSAMAGDRPWIVDNENCWYYYVDKNYSSTDNINRDGMFYVRKGCSRTWMDSDELGEYLIRRSSQKVSAYYYSDNDLCLNSNADRYRYEMLDELEVGDIVQFGKESWGDHYYNDRIVWNAVKNKNVGGSGVNQVVIYFAYHEDESQESGQSVVIGYQYPDGRYKFTQTDTTVPDCGEYITSATVSDSYSWYRDGYRSQRILKTSKYLK